MKKIGFIGAGNMATAIIKGMIAQNGSAEMLGVYDTDKAKTDVMLGMGVEVYPSSPVLVSSPHFSTVPYSSCICSITFKLKNNLYSSPLYYIFP